METTGVVGSTAALNVHFLACKTLINSLTLAKGGIGDMRSRLNKTSLKISFSDTIRESCPLHRIKHPSSAQTCVSQS